MKEVKDISPEKNINKLVDSMKESGGFVAKKLGLGVEILESSIKDQDCIKFLSFPACIISTGTRGIIKDLVKNKLVDVIITTCGMLDHDLARIWKNYYHGTFMADDKELHKQGINRLGNIFIPNECYGEILEDKFQPILEKIYEKQKELSTRDLIWAIGEQLELEQKKEESIIYWAWKNQIPIFIPGITDGSIGAQLWMFYQAHKDFKINVLEDEQQISDIIFEAKKSSALMIGGGISKHHVIWWNQFKDGLDYAVYLTTAPEWDGSLSGARIREAVSWGKVKEDARFVTIEGDATILLPIIISALKQRLNLK